MSIRKTNTIENLGKFSEWLEMTKNDAAFLEVDHSK